MMRMIRKPVEKESRLKLRLAKSGVWQRLLYWGRKIPITDIIQEFVRVVRWMVMELPVDSYKFATSRPYRRGVYGKTRKVYGDVKELIWQSYYEAPEGRLAYAILIRMSWRRLVFAKSRTAVTAGAIAIGTGAIVFLVSFGYGLQEIVTKRLVRPHSMELADVQSGSTALRLDGEAMRMIEGLSGVEEVEPAVTLAGMVKYEESKTDVVVVGSRARFLEFVHTEPLAGEFFSEEADAEYTGETPDLHALMSGEEGEVAGITTDEGEVPVSGGEIEGEKVYFRIADGEFVPLWSGPDVKAMIVGYVRGSNIERYEAVPVWGSTYLSVDTSGKWYQDSIGGWWGRWLPYKGKLYEMSAPNVYTLKIGGTQEETSGSGYLTFARVRVLGGEEVRKAEIVDQVLGLSDEASESAVITASGSADLATLVSDGGESEAESLQALLKQNLAGEEASRAAVYALAEVLKKGGKEIVVSKGFLSLWGVTVEEVLGRVMNVEYIVSGNLVEGLTGRVVSSGIDYVVVGVVDEDTPIVYAPLSDLESMGVSRYSVAKVLGASSDDLTSVRERIEAMGFTTQSLVDTLLQVNRLFRIMRFLLGMFGMIALVVALFGMFNTLTVSLMERTREVGVMKTMGTTDYDVVRMFLMESLMIGVLGGLLGIGLGMLMGSVIDGVIMLLRWDTSVQLFTTPLWFVLAMLFVAIAVGLVTGLYPASRAKKMTALDALRYE